MCFCWCVRWKPFPYTTALGKPTPRGIHKVRKRNARYIQTYWRQKHSSRSEMPTTLGGRNRPTAQYINRSRRWCCSTNWCCSLLACMACIRSYHKICPPLIANIYRWFELGAYSRSSDPNRNLKNSATNLCLISLTLKAGQ